MSGLVKDLLDCKGDDLLRHKDVVAAYRGLLGSVRGVIRDGKYQIPGPIEKVAWDMRDACDEERFEAALVDVITYIDMRGGIDGRSTYRTCLRLQTKERWIIATTLAFQETNKDNIKLESVDPKFLRDMAEARKKQLKESEPEGTQYV